MLSSAQEKKAARILIVEDTIQNQRLLKSMLSRLGYQAEAAHNGQEALDALDDETYDLVLMDCKMPVLDGYEATRRWRQQEAGKAHTIIIGVTANAMEGDREQCLEAGMDDYLSKPFRLQEITDLLKKWLG